MSKETVIEEIRKASGTRISRNRAERSLRIMTHAFFKENLSLRQRLALRRIKKRRRHKYSLRRR